MRSVKLARAINAGTVLVRTGKSVTGQIFLKFRNPDLKPRLFSAYPLKDQAKIESFTNLSLSYSADQLKNSNLEELIIGNHLELAAVG